MAWVRYDDGFYAHDKVGSLIAQGAKGIEAVGLHVLANTWSAASRRPGFVPTHQPGVLVASPQRGKALARMLQESGLWDAVEGGWEFHDAADYRASAKRQTPGTPADLSAKRAAAGRRGGTTTAAKRQANGAANQANGEARVQQESSNACSPVVASNEATPVPVPTTSGLLEQTATDIGALVGEFVDHCRERPPSSVVARIGREVKNLVADGTAPDAIRGGLSIVADRGLQPTALPGAVHEHLNARPRQIRGDQTTSALQGARARAEEATRTHAERKALP